MTTEQFNQLSKWIHLKTQVGLVQAGVVHMSQENQQELFKQEDQQRWEVLKSLDD